MALLFRETYEANNKCLDERERLKYEKQTTVSNTLQSRLLFVQIRRCHSASIITSASSGTIDGQDSNNQEQSKSPTQNVI